MIYSGLFSKVLTLALVPLTQSICASAHGYVQSAVVGGQVYTGWLPFTDPYASPIPQRVVRKIPSDGPITDDQDPNLACNTGGEQGAGLIANASAGSTVKFEWTNWPSDHLGPVSTYMTSCGEDCTAFDVNGAKWFKIDAEGYDNGSWASAKLIANNNTWISVIPQALQAGQYLMRNEIVALHSNPPQYYPSCTQVRVSGGGNAQPSADETVGIPGLYDNVRFPDIWTEAITSWPAPGPPVVSFAASGSGSENSSPPPSDTSAGAGTVTPGEGESGSTGTTDSRSAAGNIPKPTASARAHPSALTGPSSRQCRLQISSLETTAQRRSWFRRYFEL